MGPFSLRPASGPWGESVAVETLKREGYRIRERNFRCPFGEIDVIGEDGAILAFVEVKTRRTPDFDPTWSISALKRRHLIRTAQWYLKRYRPERLPVCRFDAVLVGGAPDRPALPKVTVLKGVIQDIHQ